MKPTRTEAVMIRFGLDNEQAHRLDSLVKAITPIVPETEDGDTLTVTYRFCVQYFGEVEARLNAILDLMRAAPETIKHVDSHLIDGASCLIGRVVENLLEIKERTRDSNS